MLSRNRNVFVVLACSLLLLASVLSAPLYAHGFMDTEIPEATNFPPIEQDIDLLKQYGAQAKQAAARLVMQGDAVLEPAHRALQSSQVTYPQKLQLITLLGDIGDPSSVQPILHAAESSVDPYLYQNTLLALIKFEPNDDIRRFVDKQLAQDKQAPIVIRSALAYYSQQPTPQAARWVETYAKPSANEDVRYAALYLGGMLGMQQYKQDIVDLLYSGVGGSRQYYLLQGLVELTEPDEFHRLTQNLKFYGNNRGKIDDYIRLRKGSNSQRAEQAERLLSHGDISQKLAAVKFLIGQNNAAALATGWRVRDPFVTASVKRAGYEIDIHGDQANFRALQPTQNINGVTAMLILVSIVGVVIYIWRKTR